MSAWLRIVVRQSIEHGLNSDYRVAVILSCLIIGIHVKQGNLPIVVKRLFKPFPVANRIKLVPAANTSVFVHFGEDRRRIYTISQFSVFVFGNLFQECQSPLQTFDRIRRFHLPIDHGTCIHCTDSHHAIE